HEADLPDGPERALGHELVQHVERLHGHGEPDARAQVGVQEASVAGLATDDAVVAAVEEADELQLVGLASSEDLAPSRSASALRALGAPGGHGFTAFPARRPATRLS